MGCFPPKKSMEERGLGKWYFPGPNYSEERRMRTFKDFLLEAKIQVKTFQKAEIVSSEGIFTLIWFVRKKNDSGTFNIVEYDSLKDKITTKVVTNKDFKSFGFKEIKSKQVPKDILDKIKKFLRR